MASYLKKEISEWSTSDLCNWLLDNKFRGISELFQKYSISGYDLFYINDDILKNELGLNSFHERNVTLKLISKLTYEHLKLNIINSNGDNVILTLDNNHETSLEQISDYVGNMFNIDSKNILFKDSTKQEVLSPTIKIIKLLILYPKIYKTLYISNMKDYHQVDDELMGSAINSRSKIDNNNNTNIKFNSICTMEQSMNEREIMNNNYTKNNVNEIVYQNNDNNENQKNLIENNNYNYNNINFNNKNNDNNSYLINSGLSNMMNNEDDMDIKNDKFNIKVNNQNTNIINNINTNTNENHENLNNENRERMYKSEKRIYRTVNDFNQKKKLNENYQNIVYDDNELSMSSGNEEELKFKPSYQIKKNNNLNKENFYTFHQNNNNIQKNMEQRGRQTEYMPSKNNDNKNFYKNKVFNEDFIDDPNYNNKIINN